MAANTGVLADMPDGNGVHVKSAGAKGLATNIVR
jgi:hypothetical protein